ncbi:VOC family protein [Pandoraea sp.]|uniref:VOC family protein n=1 Tax=Pandoraea sp. TaxID=1883445 RepID=UPI0012241A6B|nr:VOC family protein [Pandoraea sp.]TAL54855.1 MAG: VOC family protein [Pandoraea sp.]TAM18377.1 MAG: VOC family protein [Pandoraea sp.]
MNATQLDHLVIAAATLEAGEQYVIEQLALDERDRPVRGGKHAGMGTHNSLLNLWGGSYLEIIAIDPVAPPPTRPRWFGLDEPATVARLQDGPFLAHWVVRLARPRQLTRWQQQYPQRIAPVIPMARGDLRWHISVPENGALPGWPGQPDQPMLDAHGVLPTVIQWDTPAHPSTRLPASGCALKCLRAFHPQAEQLREPLRWLGADRLLQLDATLVEPTLAAEIETPAGVRTLK